MRAPLRICVTAALLLGIAAPLSRAGAQTGTDVRIVDFDYSPVTQTIDVNTKVTWSNTGARPHTVTDRGGTFDTGVVPPGPEGGRFAGTNVSVTISKPGTFGFHCEIHPAAMKGTVTVTGEARAGPAAASSASRNVGIDMQDFAFAPPEISVAP